MARKNDSWGIEVGGSAIKAVRLARSGSKAELVDYEILPFKHVLTTPDLNVDEAIQVNLDALLSKHDLSRSQVVISVPGHMAFARFAKLPPVEPKKIPDIVRFEAVQQIPFPIEQVEWDYQVFQQEDSPDVEVGIFAITKERVANFLSNYRRVNMRVDGLTLSPLAVFNAFAYDEAEDGERPGTIYMDIGTTATDVIIVEHEGIWLRTLPIGGNNFTEALVRAFKLSFPKAEKLKREAGTSKYARQIFQAMRPVFADLMQELQRSIGYYHSLNRDADLKRLVGVGSTFKLPGLQKFLKQQLQMEVIRPDGYKRLSVDGKREAEFADHAVNLATAYGLALQGLGLESVSANVLPAHMMKQRMWKAKQPWIAAAAACIAVGAGISAGYYFMASSSYYDELAASDAQINRVLRQAENYASEWEQISTGADPRVRIENLRRTMDYRDLWPKILQDVSLASMALNPQEATLGNDHQALLSLPRDQWRRIFIEEIRPAYIPGAAGEEDPMAMAAGPADPQTQISQPYTADTFFTETAGPRIEITLVGTTPYQDAAALLSANFVQWLRDNAERPDRPYRIIVPEKPFVSMQQVRTGASGGRTLRPTAVVPSSPGEAFGGPGRSGPGGSGGSEAAMPQRPPEFAPQQGDWRFELRWSVQLLRPEAARQTEFEGASPGEAPAEPAEPAPTQPEPEQAAAPAARDDQEARS